MSPFVRSLPIVNLCEASKSMLNLFLSLISVHIYLNEHDLYDCNYVLFVLKSSLHRTNFRAGKLLKKKTENFAQ